MSEALQAPERPYPPYQSPHKARELLGECSAAFLYKLLGEGRIRGVKAGGKLLIDTLSIYEYLVSLPPANIAPRKSTRK